MAFKAKVLGREALTRKLERLTPGVTAAAAKVKLEVVREAASRIEAAAPVGATGAYKDSIIGARQADMPGKKPVGGGQSSKDPDATAVYADFRWKFLEFGTAPHKIVAKNAPALVFGNGKGGLTVTTEVNHPGSRAKPHVFPTWKAYRKTAKSKINRAINKAVKDSLGK